jgi:regulator of protease activity HflC (stomatin/prohibitin superfamily)
MTIPKSIRAIASINLRAVERANGDAEAKLKLADADRQSTVLSAQGRSEGIRLEGEARAAEVT